jgi:hypothetical protein
MPRALTVNAIVRLAPLHQVDPVAVVCTVMERGPAAVTITDDDFQRARKLADSPEWRRLTEAREILNHLSPEVADRWLALGRHLEKKPQKPV